MNNEFTNNKKGFDLYEVVTNRMIELLEQGTVPWKHFAIRPLTSPRNAVTPRSHS
jgi:antirestriction protein ArdC